jgi:hypothetical protein
MTLGALYILTPTVGWAAPLVWPIALAAAGLLGYKHVTGTAESAALRAQAEGAVQSTRTIELNLDVEITDVVSDDLKRDQVLVFTRDDIALTFQRDLRGKFSVRVAGPAEKSRRELEGLGREFIGVVVQQFAYNKMAQEMERRGANVVGEEVTEEGDIVLKLRRWE